MGGRNFMERGKEVSFSPAYVWTISPPMCGDIFFIRLL